MNDDYSYDTGAIRDVANNDMAAIAADLEEARTRFGGTGQHAAEALRGHTSSIDFAFGMELGASPFAVLSEKWHEASAGIVAGLGISVSRVGDAAESLRQTADEYDGVETRVTARFERLLRSHDESQV